MAQKKSINNKLRIFISIALAVFSSAALAVSYKAVELTKNISQSSYVAKFFYELSYVLDGFGIVYLFAAAFIAWAVYKTWKHRTAHPDGPEILWKIICVIFGVLNCLGNFMYAFDKLPHSMGKFWTLMFIFLSCAYGFMFYIVTYWIKLFLTKKLYSADLAPSSKSPNKLLRFIEAHPFAFACIVIAICWLPWIVIYYPGSMDNDVFRMLDVYMGYYPKDNHHPWLACCLIGICYKFGLTVGNENLGIFIYVLLRDVILIAIYAKCVSFLKKCGIRPLIYILTTLFFAITPVWGAYAKHTFKDTFGAALFCLYIIWFVELIFKVKNDNDKIFDYIKYGLIGTFSSLIRNNFIYVVLFATAVFAVYCLVKKRKIYKIIIMILCVALYTGYNSYLFNIAGVEQGPKGEALSVILQMSARTIKYHSDTITDEERKAIDEYINYETIGERYMPELSDPVKSQIREEYKHEISKDYLKTWLKMGFKYPASYIAAFIGGSYGYYAFHPKWWEHAGNWNSGMTIFYWIGTNFFDNAGNFINLKYPDSTAGARDALQQYSEVWNDIPVLNLTNMPAIYFWMAVIIFYLLLRKRKFIELLPVFAVILLIGTCMASPVNGCFRYLAPAAASVPVLLALLPPALLPAGKSPRPQ